MDHRDDIRGFLAPVTAPKQTRLLIPSSALLWGLQFAFLNPVLALLLSRLFDASPADVGWVLAVYNASGFFASVVVPAYADRRHDYLRPMLACGVLTLALAGVLAVATSLPFAVIALIVLGGPAGVGSSMLFAHLRHSGADAANVVNTRAYIAFAWVAGPPLATLIMGAFGDRAVLLAIAAIAVLNIAATAAMMSRSRVTGAAAPKQADDGGAPVSKVTVAVVVLGFIALQASNSAAVSFMGLFVSEGLRLDVIWAGAALGTCAALEVPALILVARLGRRFSSLALISSGCVAGIAYYVAMVFVSHPAVLIAVQVLNAWFFATVAGVGLTLFQRIIPRPGLSSGLWSNTARLGAVVSGAVISIGTTTALGYHGVFACAAGLVVLAMILLGLTGRATGRTTTRHESRQEPPSDQDVRHLPARAS
jgi:MFS transporter, SET family, sugar efflux transporter